MLARVLVSLVALLLLAGCSATSSPTAKPRPTTAAPAASFTPQTYSTPPPGYSTTAVSAACGAAVQAAATAAINNEGANNPELFAAADACSTAAEFATAMIRFPDAAGAVSLDEQGAADFLQIVCLHSARYAACVDARANGWFA